jgi:hypothetical protein
MAYCNYRLNFVMSLKYLNIFMKIFSKGNSLIVASMISLQIFSTIGVVTKTFVHKCNLPETSTARPVLAMCTAVCSTFLLSSQTPHCN